MQKITIFLCLLTLSIYYSFQLGSLIPQKQLYFLFNIYNQQAIQKYISNPSDPISSKLQTLKYFYKKDSEIFFNICNRDDLQPQDLFSYCHEALMNDPQNTSILRRYLKLLFSLEDVNRTISVLDTLSPVPLPFSESTLRTSYSKSFYELLPTQTTVVNEYWSQIFYQLGMVTLHDNPDVTEKFWEAARDISPDWGYFHVELASLEYHELGNEEKAIQVLTTCSKYPSAANECERTNIKDIKSGDAYEFIHAIPVFPKK